MTKTISFAIVHFTVAFTAAYLLTGSLAIGGLVALVEPLCNTVACHFHEKAWAFFGRARDMPPTGFGHGSLSGVC